MRKILRAGIFLLLIFFQGCSAAYQPYPHAADAKEQSIIDKLYEHFRVWKGVQYCYGGLSKSGIDCSGFIYVTFRERFHLILPRVTKRQKNVGIDISVKRLKAGDLLFFKTSSKQSHVGIYIEEGKFMHSSSSQGVMISYLTNAYWKKAFRFAKRVEELDR